MSKKLAIAGHPTRGNEVIELLEMLGGINDREYIGTNTWKDEYYFLDNGYIRAYDWCDAIKFTLEGFWMKYPFKIGDKVVYMDDNDILVISKIKWDDTVGDIFYNVKGIDEDDCFWCPPELLKPYKETNKELAIKGHPTRGNEVIALLEMLGGKNHVYSGKDEYHIYFIDNEGMISTLLYNDCCHTHLTYQTFTLDEFYKKYPFKVGDKVFLYDNITIGCVTGMKWEENTVKYCVYTSAECWCDVKDLLKWNALDLVEKHYEEQCEEMLKDITLKHLYELGMENIKDNFKLVPNKMDDKLEYEIVDGYEFDRVEKGKIILKPIKPKYPKTYKECCDVLLIPPYYNLRYHTYQRGYYEYATSNTLLSLQDKLNTLGKVIICRDAYWKILGEEMGLGKPWNPDWKNTKNVKYGIALYGDIITKMYLRNENAILAFPTEEMRDAFYENFKELIESCKELL